ncbi:hypothetical protein ACFV2N_42000 [Streptomyces sp. NPDC059680]|uniref:hypothetical protein n=1 Tax=Streptomyces TaxID=1883 RepID=UPI001E353F48|nr:hypothetical protein [Streptomyces barringtoniae]MCC5475413.1 hypothetical protein [Streptomyces barringtoniae]
MHECVGRARVLVRTSAYATLTGTHPGRSLVRQRTVYAPVGLPWQDLTLTWLHAG